VNDNTPVSYGKKYGEGDTVGCGIDWGNSQFFFTLNGKQLETRGDALQHRIYPVVGFVGENAEIKANCKRIVSEDLIKIGIGVSIQAAPIGMSALTIDGKTSVICRH